jgi:hypothetical protein
MKLTMRNKNNIEGLLELISLLPSNILMAEIGCYSGESTELFLRSGKIQTLYAIDIWEDSLGLFEKKWPNHNFTEVEKTFDERLKNYENVVKLKMTMEEAKTNLPLLDFVYIDGNHHYEFVKEDIKNSLSKLKPNGIISGHDYHPSCPGSIKAVNEMLGKPDKIFSDGSWVVNLKK